MTNTIGFIFSFIALFTITGTFLWYVIMDIKDNQEIKKN